MSGQVLNKVAVSFDDFYDDYHANAMNYLWYLKSIFPTFRATLFAVPARISESGMVLMRNNSSWLQFAVHGWDHDQNEVLNWDEAKCNEVLDKAEAMHVFVKGFKAPNWAMSDTMRTVLAKRDYWVAELHDQHDKAFLEKNFFCTCNPLSRHGHTWDTPSKNGIGQQIEAGLNYTWKTEFLFIDELFNKSPVTHG